MQPPVWFTLSKERPVDIGLIKNVNMKKYIVLIISLIVLIFAVGAIWLSCALSDKNSDDDAHKAHPVDLLKSATEETVESVTLHLSGEVVYCSKEDIREILTRISATEIGRDGQERNVNGSLPDFTVNLTSGETILLGKGHPGHIRINHLYYSCSNDRLSDFLNGIYRKYYFAAGQNSK